MIVLFDHFRRFAVPPRCVDEWSCHGQTGIATRPCRQLWQPSICTHLIKQRHDIFQFSHRIREISGDSFDWYNTDDLRSGLQPRPLMATIKCCRKSPHEFQLVIVAIAVKQSAEVRRPQRRRRAWESLRSPDKNRVMVDQMELATLQGDRYWIVLFP